MEGYLEEYKRRLISLIETYFPILAEATKRFSTIACFCESVQSVLMWSHYASSHTGFALEYNFRPTLKNPIKNVVIAPVIYQDHRIDISSYLVWAFLIIWGVRTTNPDMLASIKNALYKSMDWAYEKEWRLIDCSLDSLLDSPVAKECMKEDIITYFKVLFVSDAGWNLRNLISHGLINANSFNYTMSDRVVHAMLIMSQFKRI